MVKGFLCPQGQSEARTCKRASNYPEVGSQLRFDVCATEPDQRAGLPWSCMSARWKRVLM